MPNYWNILSGLDTHPDDKTPSRELTPRDATGAPNSEYGASIDAKANVRVVGAPGDDTVYFELLDSDGNCEHRLSIPAMGEIKSGKFGSQVKIVDLGVNACRIVASSPEATVDTNDYAGSVAVIDIDFSNLPPSVFNTSIHDGTKSFGGFGSTLELCANPMGGMPDIVVGAPYEDSQAGNIYFLNNTAGVFLSVSRDPFGQADYMRFGQTLGMSGDTLLAATDNSEDSEGQVELVTLTRDAQGHPNGYNHTATLRPDAANFATWGGADFGKAIATEGEYVAIGAPGYQGNDGAVIEVHLPTQLAKGGLVTIDGPNQADDTVVIVGRTDSELGETVSYVSYFPTTSARTDLAIGAAKNADVTVIETSNLPNDMTHEVATPGTMVRQANIIGPGGDTVQVAQGDTFTFCSADTDSCSTLKTIPAIPAGLPDQIITAEDTISQPFAGITDIEAPAGAQITASINCPIESGSFDTTEYTGTAAELTSWLQAREFTPVENWNGDFESIMTLEVNGDTADYPIHFHVLPEPDAIQTLVQQLTFEGQANVENSVSFNPADAYLAPDGSFTVSFSTDQTSGYIYYDPSSEEVKFEFANPSTETAEIHASATANYTADTHLANMMYGAMMGAHALATIPVTLMIGPGNSVPDATPDAGLLDGLGPKLLLSLIGTVAVTALCFTVKGAWNCCTVRSCMQPEFSEKARGWSCGIGKVFYCLPKCCTGLEKDTMETTNPTFERAAGNTGNIGMRTMPTV